MSITTTGWPAWFSSRATAAPTRPYPHRIMWSRAASTDRAMFLASRRPLATSSTTYSLMIPMDPKMMATPATDRSMAHTRPAVSNSWTSRNPTVVRVVTVW